MELETVFITCHPLIIRMMKKGITSRVDVCFHINGGKIKKVVIANMRGYELRRIERLRVKRARII